MIDDPWVTQVPCSVCGAGAGLKCEPNCPERDADNEMPHDDEPFGPTPWNTIEFFEVRLMPWRGK